MLTTTPQTRAEMRERCDAAKSRYDLIDGDQLDLTCAKCGSSVDVRDGYEWNNGDWCWDCNTTFATHARTDLPALLADLESALAAIAELTAMLRKCEFTGSHSGIADYCVACAGAPREHSAECPIAAVLHKYDAWAGAATEVPQ